MTAFRLAALLAAVEVASLVVEEGVGHLPSVTLEADGDCPAGDPAACALNALQRRASKAEAVEDATQDVFGRGDNASDVPDVPPKDMVLVGEGFCCWDEESCKPDEKESPGGAYFATEDGTQCHDAVACGGTVLELCGRTEGCEAITVFAKSSPDAYVWDCQLHWNSVTLCSSLCDAPPNDNACSKRKLPAGFQTCGNWYGECENVTTPMTEIRADGTKDKWCYKKVA